MLNTVNKKSVYDKKNMANKITLCIFLLFLSLSGMDDHSSVEALQETRRFFSLLDLHLQKTHKQQI